MNKTLTLLLLICSICSTRTLAQHTSHKLYENNIVHLGERRYGFITGSEAGKYFFITVLNKTAADNESQVFAYPFKGKTAAVAKQIRTFTIGKTRFGLYTVELPGLSGVTNKYYAKYDKSLYPYYSFVDDGKDRNAWFANTVSFSQNSAPDGINVLLSTARGNSYYKGMPIVDDRNNVVGILTEDQDELGNSILCNMVDMEEIADKAQSFNNCGYFQLIESGHPLNKCQLKEQGEAQQIEDLKKARKDARVHKLAIGIPALSRIQPIYSVADNTVLDGNFMSVGFAVFLKPDAGTWRLAFKPHVMFNSLRAYPDAVPGNAMNGYKAKAYRWKTFELPIMLESIGRLKNSNVCFGIGYAPGWQTDVKYLYTTDKSTARLDAIAVGTGGLSHNIYACMGFEMSKIRLDFLTGYQVSGWRVNYETDIDGHLTDPFSGMGYRYFMLGFELTYRLNGKWGIKNQ